jgi:hypothetical protein
MLIRHVAIVSQSDRLGLSEVNRVAAALSKQVARDFGPIWGIRATVDAFEHLRDVPLGYWPVVVRDNIGYNAAGIHLDRNHQPFALVSSGSDWSLTASHEVLEMLADPFGNRLVAGESPVASQGRVEFLVEVCDPSEAASYGYTVNSILVSDFYTPHYFDPVRAQGVRYSYTGAITEPRQVLQGGYLSWRNPITNEWFQETFFSGTRPQIRSLGMLSSKTESLRSQVDRKTSELSMKAMLSARVPDADATADAGEVRMLAARAGEATDARAEALEEDIAEVLGLDTEDEAGGEGDVLRGAAPKGSKRGGKGGDEGPDLRRPRGRKC